MIEGVSFVGASGVGKTTLAKYVADNYGLKLLPSASRAAIAEMGLSDYKTLMADPDLYHQFGLRVQKLQHEMEDVCIKNGEPFVSDRGFDHIAYAVLYQSYPKPFIEEGLKRLEQVKDRRIYIHVLPDAEVRECALEQSTRHEFLDWEMMLRFDGVLHYLIEQFQIPAIQINVNSLGKRHRIVDAMLRDRWPRRAV